LTILQRLDGQPTSKRNVLQFLYESQLIQIEDTVVGLNGADLSGADLISANLSDAKGVTDEKLEQAAYSLEGATMPDGSTHD
jgi:uncharacterized protein YjbI with pentapeptide repeats